MSETQRIVDQLQRAFDGPAWHGPCLREILKDVTAEQAALKSLPGVHSIWEILLHLSVWEDVVRRRLEGEVIVEWPPEKDWPVVHDSRENAWRQFRREMTRRHRALCKSISQLEERQLGATVPGMDYSVYVMLHGVVQHDLYHAGQIALLKRASPH